MSLSSLLLGDRSGGSKRSATVDTGLDAIFRSNLASGVAAHLQAESSPLGPAPVTSPATAGAKRKASSGHHPQNSSTEYLRLSKKSRKIDATEGSSLSATKLARSSKKTKRTAPPAPTQDGSTSDDSEVENAYISRTTKRSSVDVDNLHSKHEDAAESSSDDGAIPVHESVAKSSKERQRPSKNSSSKKKYAPSDETPAQRDARTIFIGNLSAEVVKNRPLQKQLKRHILSFVPSAKVESMRFRSVAFATPTNVLSSDDSGKKKAREHNRDRAATWRETNEDEGKSDEKKFLTSAQKKKIAAITHDLHPSADIANAYIVFAHSNPVTSGTKSVSDSGSDGKEGTAEEKVGQRPRLDPFEAAKLAMIADGSIFHERTLRVDRVGGTPASGKDADSLIRDPKRTLFVGNLDFASREEDLRAYFEGLIIRERGSPPTHADDGDVHEATSNRKGSWVAHVRIVRDRDTQMGKGFAYVQFADRDCVDELLALEEGAVKFAKRKLRLQRCKTILGSTVSKAPPASSATLSDQGAQGKGKGKTSPKVSAPVVVPRGDPTLGERLVNLSKEDRKAAKASDADRLARRAAKKQAKKVAVAQQSAKIVDVVGRRKTPGAKKIVSLKAKAKKRTLSKRAVEKRNIKK